MSKLRVVRVFQIACACLGVFFGAAAGHWDTVIWAVVSAVLLVDLAEKERG